MIDYNREMDNIRQDSRLRLGNNEMTYEQEGIILKLADMLGKYDELGLGFIKLTQSKEKALLHILSMLDMLDKGENNNVGGIEMNENKPFIKKKLSEMFEAVLNEERFSDLYAFLDAQPRKMTMGTVYYVASMDTSMNKNIVTPEGKVPNPMYGKVFKHTRFMFRWQDTYTRATERINPEHVMGQRSGEYEKVEGYNMLEKKGDKFYLPIIPTGSEYKYITSDGQEISKEELKPYLKQSGPYTPSSGVDFRLLIIDKIVKLTGGGNEWVNPDFKGDYKGLGTI